MEQSLHAFVLIKIIVFHSSTEMSSNSRNYGPHKGEIKKSTFTKVK